MGRYIARMQAIPWLSTKPQFLARIRKNVISTGLWAAKASILALPSTLVSLFEFVPVHCLKVYWYAKDSASGTASAASGTSLDLVSVETVDRGEDS